MVFYEELTGVPDIFKHMNDTLILFTFINFYDERHGTLFLLSAINV